MENTGSYVLIALVLAIYLYKKKQKPQRVVNPQAKSSSKPNSKKTSTKKNSKPPKNADLTVGTPKSSPSKNKENNQLGSTSNLSDFGLLTNLSSQSLGKGSSVNLEANLSTSPTVTPTGFDLEKEVMQLQARTGWDYSTSIAYCQKSIEYHQKIASPTRLKKK
jgi:hypothetical protein